MTFGFVTLNGAGRVQIDGELPNYYVVSSGIAASDAAVARPDASHVIFVRPHTTPGKISIKSTASSTDFSVTSTTGYFEYVFVKSFSAGYPLGNNGVRVFSGAGALCFDSNAPQFNFAVGATTSLSPSVETTVSVPNPSGKKIYVSFSTMNICVFRNINGSLGVAYAPTPTFDSEYQVRCKVDALPGAAPPRNMGPFSSTRELLVMYKQE